MRGLEIKFGNPQQVLKPQSADELQGKMSIWTRREEGEIQTLGGAGVMAEAGLVSSPMVREESYEDKSLENAKV